MMVAMLALTICISTVSATCKAAPVGAVTGSVRNNLATGTYKYEKGHQLKVKLFVIRKNCSTGHVDDVTTIGVLNGDYSSVSQVYRTSNKYGILSNEVSGYVDNKFQRSVTYYTN